MPGLAVGSWLLGAGGWEPGAGAAFWELGDGGWELVAVGLGAECWELVAGGWGSGRWGPGAGGLGAGGLGSLALRAGRWGLVRQQNNAALNRDVCVQSALDLGTRR